MPFSNGRAISSMSPPTARKPSQRSDRSPYDVVLMDVQMPVMDGVAATRAIRSSDHESRSVPIVAMTANVLPQQIMALKEAGMDDHVGKPFRRADLEAAITRWARPAASNLQRGVARRTGGAGERPGPRDPR